uniref:DUF4283 domain-containing protein n=1 Tax=Nelumbo nucifera TaxID=4432 RepID=A0A822Z6B8_NELNU|nr:TPA_asm: hypothetical protein HUJ06_013544 [Nelumbo nucifera]
MLKLRPFEQNKAVGFAPSEDLMISWTNLEAIFVFGDWVQIERLWPKIDAAPDQLRFNGWLELRGLPFHLWTKEIFSLTGDTCGGLEDKIPDL